MAKNWILLGTFFGFFSVIMGAFGAHSLKEVLSPEQLTIYKTASEYQFFHSLALILLGLFAKQQPKKSSLLAGIGFTAGISFFSGSLYALALTGIRGFGAMTPVGGVLFLFGWAGFFSTAYKSR